MKRTNLEVAGDILILRNIFLLFILLFVVFLGPAGLIPIWTEGKREKASQHHSLRQLCSTKLNTRWTRGIDSVSVRDRGPAWRDPVRQQMATSHFSSSNINCISSACAFVIPSFLSECDTVKRNQYISLIIFIFLICWMGMLRGRTESDALVLHYQTSISSVCWSGNRGARVLITV